MARELSIFCRHCERVGPEGGFPMASRCNKVIGAGTSVSHTFTLLEIQLIQYNGLSL